MKRAELKFMLCGDGGVGEARRRCQPVSVFFRPNVVAAIPSITRYLVPGTVAFDKRTKQMHLYIGVYMVV